MADRLAEPDDAAVDEIKRKARRRLVGAIVLALAAAIVVPMLLEREPRSLGDEVSVQIPPVDDGKFINRLSGEKGEVAPKAGAKADASPSSAAARGAATPSNTQAVGAAPAKPITDAEQRVLAPPAQPNTIPPIPSAEKAAPSSGKAAASESKAEPAPPPAQTKPVAAAKSEPAKQEPVATNSATSAAPASQPKGEGFVVQLAAFADDKGANALAGKLKRAGYPAYTEPVQTSQGTLWRVRVGAYPSRDAASEARTKLKNDGYSGIVASAQ